MSTAAELLKRIENDSALKAKVDQAAERGVPDFLAAVAAEGYGFTLDEWVSAVRDAEEGTGSDELSDDELSAIAGGTSGCKCINDGPRTGTCYTSCKPFNTCQC